MATIKVKRNSNSRGKCKLAFNKVYTARVNPTYNRSYIIGKHVYLSEYFTVVTDQQPKPKPVIKPDPKTGKFVVEKPERDWSVPQAFPEGYAIPIGTYCITLKEDKWRDFITPKNTKVMVLGDSGQADQMTFLQRLDRFHREDCIDKNENGFCDSCLESKELAPLNPTDHPEHPEFGKVKGQSITNTWVDEFVKIEKENPKFILTYPEHFDIREVIAEYIKKFGTQLTAIELIGHLTIDGQWQSTEK